MIQFAMLDAMRRLQAQALGALGLSPVESSYEVVASGMRWRLRDYHGSASGPVVLIVPAPIKRPYIWDLAPKASAVRYCLDHGLHVYLLEWQPPGPGDGGAGLAEYADQALTDCVAAVAGRSGGTALFLLGHSLGGTLAGIFAALHPDAIKGLALLSAPLCFAEGSSRFRDALVALLPAVLPASGIVPGSLLTQVAALASPQAFVWSRIVDSVLSLGDARARHLHGRVEHWTLDEVGLPARLMRETVDWLYRENRFCRNALRIGERTIGLSDLVMPILAVVNKADDVAPEASVVPVAGNPAGAVRCVIEYPGETGVGLQHVAVLIGPQAHATVWPQVVAWLKGPGEPARAGAIIP